MFVLGVVFGLSTEISRGINSLEKSLMHHPWKCSWPGWVGSELPELVKGVPVHDRGVGAG